MPILLFFISENVFARSLKASADKLGQDATQVGLGLAAFGIAMAAIYFILGKQDAATKMTSALLGAFTLMLIPSILSFVKGVA